MKKITIVGFGRFGKTLFRLINDDFEVYVYDLKKINIGDGGIKSGQILDKVENIYLSEVIIYCVPISGFEEVIKKHKRYFKRGHLLVDVLSVKSYPKNVFEKYLKGSDVEALLTHPMFGPDSSQEGFGGLTIVLDKFKCSYNNFNYFKKYFENKGLRVVEMTAEIHDKLAASSQGLTHFIGRILDEFGTSPSIIDTLGAKKLSEIKQQTCNDSWELFNDLQHYNPFTKKMRTRIGRAYDRVFFKLLPKRVNKCFYVFGIQGGRGSFNEEAINFYLNKEKIGKSKLKYLYTSENVLKYLQLGVIDYGQFAIHNSLGGVVSESIEAMAKYKFEIVKQYAIKISHALMIKMSVGFEQIDTIMTHPQVLAQCKRTLEIKYPNLKLVSGKGELIDHAKVAKLLAGNKLPDNIAVMGSKVLAKIYNLKVVEEDLQDLKENFTSFLLVKRAK